MSKKPKNTMVSIDSEQFRKNFAAVGIVADISGSPTCKCVEYREFIAANRGGMSMKHKAKLQRDIASFEKRYNKLAQTSRDRLKETKERLREVWDLEKRLSNVVHKVSLCGDLADSILADKDWKVKKDRWTVCKYCSGHVTVSEDPEDFQAYHENNCVYHQAEILRGLIDENK